jgi:hypothetical protein
MPGSSKKSFEKELEKLEKMLKSKNNNNDDDDDNHDDDDEDNDDDDDDDYNQEGGRKRDDEPKRHFKIVILNNKEVHGDTGVAAARASVYESTANPVDAAKKLFRSICKSMGLKGMERLKCHATFFIKETTGPSSKKVYGPYKGSYENINKNGKPKIVTYKDTGKTSKFFIKPVVKKVKEVRENKKSMKKNNMKGGKTTM